MNQNIVSGTWKQIKGDVKIQWAELTDDELDEIDGRYEKMVGKLQEKYGYAEEKAAREVERFFSRYRY